MVSLADSLGQGLHMRESLARAPVSRDDPQHIRGLAVALTEIAAARATACCSNGERLVVPALGLPQEARVCRSTVAQEEGGSAGPASPFGGHR